MGFLSSLFGRKNVNVEPANQSNLESKTLPEIKQEVFADHSEPENKELSSAQYGTKMPIDAVYAFISRDYEEQGYNDAMCNADSSYKDSKKVIIRNELKRLFEQVSLRYKSDLRDIEVQIDIVEQQGLINTASSLKARKETFIEHMNVLNEMEVSLEQGQQQMLSMINSYERGFLKGLAAKSDSLLRNGNI